MRTRAVPVDYASHSAQVEAIREEILAALAAITPGPAQVPMVSAMTGQWLDGPEAGAGYWYDSLRDPVEFERAVRVLAGAGHRGVHRGFPAPGADRRDHRRRWKTSRRSRTAAGGRAPAVTGTLRRDDGGPARFLASLAEAHVRGVAVDWAAVLRQRARSGPADLRVPAPAVLATAHARWRGAMAAGGLGAVGHPLLGAAVELARERGLLV